MEGLPYVVVLLFGLVGGAVLGMITRDGTHLRRGLVLRHRYEKYNAVVAVTNQPHTALCVKFGDQWFLFTATTTDGAYAPPQYNGPIVFKPYNDLPLDILADLATGKKRVKIEAWPTDKYGIAVLVVE